MILELLVISLIAQAPDEAPKELEELEYGEIFFEEREAYELSRFNLSLGYSFNLNNAFFDIQGLSAGVQARVWRFISTGVFGQLLFNRYSSAGKQLSRLSEVDIRFNSRVPRWGVFSLTNLHLMIGKWNFMNLGTVEVNLLGGGGFGVVNKEEKLGGRKTHEISYLWSAEQRIEFQKISGGLNLSFFAHTGGTYIQPGVFFQF